MKDKKLGGIIDELKAMILRDTATLSPVEAAKEQQRMSEIKTILDAEAAQLGPRVQGIEGKDNGK